MKFLTTLCTCLFIYLVYGQTIVDKSVIEDGGTFTVTCDATRAGVPTNVDFVSSLVMAVKTGNGQTDLARYKPYPPYPTNYTSTPSSRNWTYQLTGGQMGTIDAPVNRNTIKIVLQVFDAKCTDAGNYSCNATYTAKDTLKDSVTTNTYEVTSKAKLQDPVVTLSRHNEIMGDPNTSLNIAGENLTFTCSVIGPGPTGLKMVWRYGKVSDFQGPQDYLVQNAITVIAPIPVPGNCNPYRYESKLTITMEDSLNGYTFYCVVQDNNVDAKTANMTLYTQEATAPPNTDNSASSAEVNVGAIVGPIIGGLVLIAIIVVVVYFCWYKKRNNQDKEREPDATDSNVHAPPPTFYAKPHKPPKEEKDNTDSGKINKGLDLSYEHEDSKGPPRYTNTVDDDNEPPRYDRGRSNKGYDEDNNKEERSRRHRDREGRKSRSRDPDEEPRRRYSTDDNTDNRAPYGDPGMGTAI